LTQNPHETHVPKDWIKKVQANWAPLFHAAVWLASIVATFIVLPYESSPGLANFARFQIAIITGLLFVCSRYWGSRKATLAWSIATVIFALGSTWSYFGYYGFMRAWTAASPKGPNSRVLIGAKYTSFALEQREKFRRQNDYYPDDDRLVELNAGVKDLWSDADIQQRGQVLMALYIGLMALSASSAISVTQALACATGPTTSLRVQPNPPT
jgi:hypothetical protein